MIDDHLSNYDSIYLIGVFELPTHNVSWSLRHLTDK